MRKKILTVTISLCFANVLAQSALAQRNATISDAQSPTIQYSGTDLEQMRTQLLALTDTLTQFESLAPPGYVDLDKLATVSAQIKRMSYPQLNIIRRGIGASTISNRLQGAQQAVRSYFKTRAAGTQSSPKPHFTDPNAFPVASGFCTGSDGTSYGVERIPVEVVLAADVVYFVAEGVKDAATDACNEVLVVAGEGGNTSLACEISDAIYVTAHALDEGIHFCDADLTGNVIDTNYARLADLHTDLYTVGTSLDTHLSAANTDIDTRVAALAGQVTNLAGQVTALTGQVTALSALVLASAQEILRFTTATLSLQSPVPTNLVCGTADWRTTLNLSAPAPPGGLLINLSSNNPKVAVMPTLIMAAGATTALVQVTCAGSGPQTATIVAGATPFVPNPLTVSVTFN